MGALDFMDADKDGNVIDDGLGTAASGIGTAAEYIGGGVAGLGGAITAASLAGTLPTGGLSDFGLPIGIGLGVAGGAVSLAGMGLHSDFAVNAAESLGDFLGGPTMVPGTPEPEPSLADVIPRPG